MRTYVFAKIDAGAEPPRGGERICVRIPCTELEEYLYFDFLFSCLVLDYTKEFVAWDNNYLLEEDSETSGPKPLRTVVFTGTVKNGAALHKTLLEIQERKDAASPNDTLPDEMQGLAVEMEDHWLDADTPLPTFYRDLRIKQLLFWLQQEDPDEENCRRIAKDLVAIDPEFAEWAILRDYL